MRNHLYIFLIAFVLVAAGCANQQIPQGGPKDSQPPKITVAEPANKSTNFTGDKFVLEFDEYVVLDNPTGQVVISPPLEEFPTFMLKGKKLVVKFKEDLKPNTTYTINIGAAVKDLTEGNAINNYQYVFSTGDYLDSLQVNGRVVDAATSETKEDILVFLYKDTRDSVVFEQKPYYFAKTNDQGMFNIGNVAEGEYKLFALKDVNNNLLYDLPSEAVAFWPDVIRVDSTLTPPYQLNLFVKENDKQALLSNNTKSPGKIELIYAKPVKELTLAYTQQPDIEVVTMVFNTTKDTISVWYTYSYELNQDLVVSADGLVDTISMRNSPVLPDSIPFKKLPLFSRASDKSKSTLPPLGNVGVDEPIRLHFDRPIDRFDKDKIILQEDSLKTVSPSISIDSTGLYLVMNYNWKSGSLYQLVVPDSTVFDHYGLTNDSIVLEYRSRKKEDYGNIMLHMQGLEASNNYIIELKRDDILIDTKTISGVSDSLNIPYQQQLPGSYKVVIIYDSNGNGKWDTGDYDTGRQPERTYAYPEVLKLKANWDMEMTIQLGESLSKRSSKK